MNSLFHGQIVDGKLSLDKADQFKAHLCTLNGRRVEVSVRKITHSRTNSQNLGGHPKLANEGHLKTGQRRTHSGH